MDKLPKITARRAPNFPDNVEVDLVWEGEYKTMLTFHKDDFTNGAAEETIKNHVIMVKRAIDKSAVQASFAKVLWPGIKKRFEKAYVKS